MAMLLLRGFLPLAAVWVAAASSAELATGQPSALESDEGSCQGLGHGDCYASLVQTRAASTASQLRRRSSADEAVPAGPRIYVYNLPKILWYNASVVVMRFTCEDYPVGTNETDWGCSDPRNVFGLELKLKTNATGASTPLRVHNTYQFSLGSIFWQSLLAHPRRTMNPEEADLFFVSAIDDPVTLQNHGMQSNCPPPELLVEHLIHLNEQNAARHIWVSPSVGWVNESCAAFESNSKSESAAARLLANVTKLALEDRESAPMSIVEDYMYKGAKNLNGGGLGPPVADNLHSIPYPAVTSGLDDEWDDAWRHAVAASKRDHLVSAMWGFHGSGAAVDVRSRVTKQCTASPKCFFTDLDRGDLNNYAVLSTNLRSTFCLEPPGDTPSRKGLVDALVAGCIPVLFDALQAKLWPWHVGKWSDVAVLLYPEPENVIDHLAKIHHKEVRRLQRNIKPMLRKLSYSQVGKPQHGDALEITLAAVASLAHRARGKEVARRSLDAAAEQVEEWVLR